MSDSTVINIRTDIKVKNQAQVLSKKLGLNLSAVINGFLKQFIKAKSISFSLEEEPSDFLIKSLAQAKKDIKEGYISPAFDNPKDALKWLHDPKAKYVNQL